jgi:hypothetical protein
MENVNRFILSSVILHKHKEKRLVLLAQSVIVLVHDSTATKRYEELAEHCGIYQNPIRKTVGKEWFFKRDCRSMPWIRHDADGASSNAREVYGFERMDRKQVQEKVR